MIRVNTFYFIYINKFVNDDVAEFRSRCGICNSFVTQGCETIHPCSIHNGVFLIMLQIILSYFAWELSRPFYSGNSLVSLVNFGLPSFSAILPSPGIYLRHYNISQSFKLRIQRNEMGPYPFLTFLVFSSSAFLETVQLPLIPGYRLSAIADLYGSAPLSPIFV